MMTSAVFYLIFSLEKVEASLENAETFGQFALVSLASTALEEMIDIH